MAHTDVLARLETFRELEDGWADGHRAISDAVVDTAASVVRVLPDVSLFAAPFDGAVSVMRTWPAAPEWEGRSVEVHSDQLMTLVPDWPFEHEDSGMEAVAFDLDLATAWLTEDTRAGRSSWRASVSVEFTSEEFAVVSELAQAAAYTVSSYLRVCALGAHAGTPLTSVDAEEVL